MVPLSKFCQVMECVQCCLVRRVRVELSSGVEQDAVVLGTLKVLAGVAGLVPRHCMVDVYSLMGAAVHDLADSWTDAFEMSSYGSMFNMFHRLRRIWRWLLRCDRVCMWRCLMAGGQVAWYTELHLAVTAVFDPSKTPTEMTSAVAVAFEFGRFQVITPGGCYFVLAGASCRLRSRLPVLYLGLFDVIPQLEKFAYAFGKFRVVRKVVDELRWNLRPDVTPAARQQVIGWLASCEATLDNNRPFFEIPSDLHAIWRAKVHAGRQRMITSLSALGVF